MDFCWTPTYFSLRSARYQPRIRPDETSAVQGESMRHVMVMNAKGGCGKSTLATNIACFFAREGYKVVIADYDPQRSSLDWLELRPEDLPSIGGVPAYDDGLRNVPRDTEVLVIDAPARTHGSEMNELVRR